MGIIISRFRKKQSTKEILEQISKDLESIEEYQVSTQQRHKRIIGYLVAYSIVLYLAAALIFYLYYLPDELQDILLYSTPFVAFPIIIYIVKRLLTWHYRRKICRNEKKLSELKERRAQILDQVMETETYKVAKEILEKYAPDQLRRNNALFPIHLRLPLPSRPSPRQQQQQQEQEEAASSSVVGGTRGLIKQWESRSTSTGEVLTTGRLVVPVIGKAMPTPAPTPIMNSISSSEGQSDVRRRVLNTSSSSPATPPSAGSRGPVQMVRPLPNQGANHLGGPAQQQQTSYRSMSTPQSVLPRPGLTMSTSGSLNSSSLLSSRTSSAAAVAAAAMGTMTTPMTSAYGPSQSIRQAGLGTAPGPPMPRPVLPRERGYMDRFIEYLVGDGPANRYALVCRQCESHNGMALKEEFEYLAFRCAYCFYWNPSRKQRPTAPRLEDLGKASVALPPPPPPPLPSHHKAKDDEEGSSSGEEEEEDEDDEEEEEDGEGEEGSQEDVSKQSNQEGPATTATTPSSTISSSSQITTTTTTSSTTTPTTDNEEPEELKH
ncbi:endoplasmic reticulum junction formation protein lunapark-A-like isoform X2 [Oratosquilla oratoria]|uniref:endoplasmic reticulum junction formation protein lunapark-A-like isoform X2 n=1 Tax=Oratosquilla oratoria TaxID=337810 RepID=UPI003F769766